MAVLCDDAVLFPGLFKLKTAAEDFSVVPPFEIRSGAEQRVPFLFNSPHSGRHYPERFLAMARLDRNAIRRALPWMNSDLSLHTFLPLLIWL